MYEFLEVGTDSLESRKIVCAVAKSRLVALKIRRLIRESLVYVVKPTVPASADDSFRSNIPREYLEKPWNPSTKSDENSPSVTVQTRWWLEKVIWERWCLGKYIQNPAMIHYGVINRSCIWLRDAEPINKLHTAHAVAATVIQVFTSSWAELKKW